MALKSGAAMTPAEQEFHDKWLEVFIKLEHETVFGIGFNPWIVEQYTPEMVTRCQAIYRSRKRFRPTALFRSLIKWIAGLGTIVCMTLITINQILDISLPFLMSVIIKQKEIQTDMTKERDEILKKLVAAEAQTEMQKIKVAKLQHERELQEEAEHEIAIAKEKASASYNAEACSKARTLACDKVKDNIIEASIYHSGERIECIITLDARFPDKCNSWNPTEIKISKSGKWVGQHCGYNYDNCYSGYRYDIPIHSIKAK